MVQNSCMTANIITVISTCNQPIFYFRDSGAPWLQPTPEEIKRIKSMKENDPIHMWYFISSVSWDAQVAIRMQQRFSKTFSPSELKSRAWWRDLFAECIATFLLVSVQCALPLTWGRDNLGSALHTAMGMGFIVTTTVWSMAEFGGIHMNPALSVSMVLAGRITLLRGKKKKKKKFMYIFWP